MPALYLHVMAGVIGLLAGATIAYAGPRLVAYRLPEPIPLPPALVLLPVAGAWLRRWEPVRTILLEVVTALVLLALTFRYGESQRLVVASGYSILLIAIGYIDVDHRLVLNRLTYPGVVLAVGASLLWPRIGPASAALGAITGLAVFVALQLVGRGALGTGDTKLAVLVGAMRGFPGVFNALLLGVVLGGVGAIFSLLVLRRGRKEYMAYAPYLAVGAILSFFLSSP
jgi:leader peptidase (prepilin peptidase)/N-methyltransferase